MRPTLRCAVAQMMRLQKPSTPLLEFMKGAVIRNTNQLLGSAVGQAARQPGAVVRGCSTECENLFTNTSCDIFEGNNRQAWVDLRRGYCHLCQEPVGTNLGMHVGDRDHTNMQFFLFLYAVYPRRDFLREAFLAGTAGHNAALFHRDSETQERLKGHSSSNAVPDAPMSAVRTASSTAPTASFAEEPVVTSQPLGGMPSRRAASSLSTSLQASESGPLWKIDDVLHDIRGFSPALHRFATDHRTTDQLHTMDDATRRSELEALLFYLTHPPHQAVTGALQGTSSFGFWYSGERVWKYEMTRLISQVFPPMSAGMMTNFTQKCWGRSNEERLYDALQLHRIKAYYGWGPYASKEKKAFFVRQLIFELLMAEVRPELSETTKLLASQAVRRMAFELIFLLSMDYMHRVQHVHELLGRPTVMELKALNLL